jgi:hypothetical protein
MFRFIYKASVYADALTDSLCKNLFVIITDQLELQGRTSAVYY